MLSWAADPRNNKLPPGWLSPVTRGLVGTPPAKDPFRRDLLPLSLRVRLVELMDAWQFCTLLPSLLLPMRPDEAVGLLVDDLDLDKSELLFGCTAQSLQNTALAWHERRRFGQATGGVAASPPVFVLGHLRGGATHLHDLLAANDRRETSRGPEPN